MTFRILKEKTRWQGLFYTRSYGNKYKLVTLLKRETEEIIGRTVLAKGNFI